MFGFSLLLLLFLGFTLNAQVLGTKSFYDKHTFCLLQMPTILQCTVLYCNCPIVFSVACGLSLSGLLPKSHGGSISELFGQGWIDRGDLYGEAVHGSSGSYK